MELYDDIGRDPRKVGDALLAKSPVVRSSSGDWVVLGHEEVVSVATDPERFSSQVSAYLQLPNGLDGAEHRKFRTLIDRYLDSTQMAILEPRLVEVARQLISEVPRDQSFEAVFEIGAKFAVRAMLAWLGWETQLKYALVDWVQANRDASRAGDSARMAKVADDFDEIITQVVEPRRGPDAPDDVTTALIHDTSLGRQLTQEEIVSILRNWTGGDLSSMALCVGVVLHDLAARPELQERVRVGTDAEATAIILELLRIDNPFVTNRRVTTCPVTIGGVEIAAGQRVRVHWTAANRDVRVFEGFDPDQNEANNLVFGIGPHDCPGRELTLLELRVITQAVLAAGTIELAGEPEREVAPVGGYASVPLLLS